MNNEIINREEKDLISNDITIFSNDKKMFSTLKSDNMEDKIKLYNSLQKCDVRINDIVGQEIEFEDIFIEEKPSRELNEETGEVVEKTRKFRTILFGTDGATYVSSAYGVYNSLKNIVAIFGFPTKENPIKVKVAKRSTQTGKETLILVIVNI